MDSDSEDAGYALDGLREVMAVKSNVALPFLIPKLTHEPLTAQNAHALKALAEVSGEVCGPLRVLGMRGHERLQQAPWRRFFLISSLQLVRVMDIHFRLCWQALNRHIETILPPLINAINEGSVDSDAIRGMRMLGPVFRSRRIKQR
jgi:hypothetical protein